MGFAGGVRSGRAGSGSRNEAGESLALDGRLAVSATDLSHRHRLPLADGIIYATAREASAELLTQDADLEGLPGVTYIPHLLRGK